MAKTLKELTIKDDFMFSAVMAEEENCRGLLELVTGISVDRVEVSRERSFVYHPEYKGVRMDVYAKDEKNTRYNVEMQMLKKPALSRRSRYYRSQLDMDLLVSGCGYEALPDTYVIFICDFDPFGKGYYRYRFENICLEDGCMRLKDGCYTIFLNTRGKNEKEVPKALADFLRYAGASLEESQRDFQDAYVKRLQMAVKKVKSSREMEERFMTLEEMLRDERKEGEARGYERGEINGRAASVLTFLEEKGNVPKELRERISQEKSLDVLQKWLKLSAKAESIRQFEEQMEQ